MQAPAMLAACAYCGQPLYVAQPVSLLEGPPAHVACAVFARSHPLPAKPIGV